MTTTETTTHTQTLTEEQAKEMYNEALDSLGAVKIGFGIYYPSTILKEVDPIAYRVGFNDYIDSLMEDGYRVEGWD